MNVFIRDTFREELISNDDDVSYSYADCVLDRVNTDAKVYRNAFIDQGNITHYIFLIIIIIKK